VVYRAARQVLRRGLNIGARLVIERQAERVAEGHKGALHRVRLGFLEGAFVRLPNVLIDALPEAAALADDGVREVLTPYGDADLGRVIYPPLAVHFVGLAELAKVHGFAGPVAEAENAVGFRDCVPAFDVGNLPSALRARG